MAGIPRAPRHWDMTIDILCKVVDNYGDIGLVWRLARALRDEDPGMDLRIIVDDIAAFRALAPDLESGQGPRILRGMTVLPWEEEWPEMRENRPRFVIECFACGRPDWFDAILYDSHDEGLRKVVNLEYLSAEDYARDFHLLPSATRSALVKKTLFMPGFSPGTGGLVLGRAFMEARAAFLDQERRPYLRQQALAAAGIEVDAEQLGSFWLGIFSYERDYHRVVADLAAWNRPILALVAPGKSAGPFLEAWEDLGRPFPALALPFLAQETWDRVLLASDFSIVRGEESLARAALAGKPFLWHAYLQAEKHHLVKVEALLERMRPFFPTDRFNVLAALFRAFNDREQDGPGSGGQEALSPFLEALETLAPGFKSFSESLIDLGDLASHLLTFFKDLG